MVELGKGNNGKDIDAGWLLELWEKAPTPAEAARIRKASVAAILKRNRIRRHDAAGVLGILRQQPLEVGSGTIGSATAHIRSLIARLKLVNQELKQAHTRLDELLAEILGDDDSGLEEEQRDVSILRSLPGVGPIVLSTLLAEAPQALAERDYDYATLRTLTGVAPVTRRSGKSCVVIMRRACNKRLREAMYHWARVAIQHDPGGPGEGHAPGSAPGRRSRLPLLPARPRSEPAAVRLAVAEVQAEQQLDGRGGLPSIVVLVVACEPTRLGRGRAPPRSMREPAVPGSGVDG